MKIVINTSGIGLNLSLQAVEYLIKYRIIKSPLDVGKVNRNHPRLIRCIEVLGDDSSLDILKVVDIEDEVKYHISPIKVHNRVREIIYPIYE